MVSAEQQHLIVSSWIPTDWSLFLYLGYAFNNVHIRDDRGGGAGGGGGGGMDGPIGAGGPDVPTGPDAPPSKERTRLKLAPRSKPVGQVAAGAAAPAPATAKKASIFGGGKAHDEFAYEVRRMP